MKYGEWTLGQTEALLNKLGGMDVGLKILRGELKIELVDNLIVDLDADPFCPDGWTVVSHKEGGKRKFDRDSIGLYLADGQKNSGRMVGNDLRAVLADQSVENANQLDWYLAHPDQIPEEWKGKYIFFWGTIYRSADRGPYVRCLCWSGDGWSWYCHWLGSAFGGGSPAAVRK